MARSILAYDFFTSCNTDHNMSIEIVSPNGIGMESNVVTGTNILLKDVSRSQYEDLKKGLSFLEFWIPAIDHSKVTDNGKRYPKEEFIPGMEKCLNKVIKNGGMQPGEHNHPIIIPDKNLTPEEDYVRIASRLTDFPPERISHYVVDTKTEGEKTFFKIRTSTANPIICEEIFMGKVPTFSIRTLGEFRQENGEIVGRNLVVITTDYVYNPANKESRPVASDIRYIDNTSGTKFKVDMVENVGNESLQMLGYGLENEEIVYEVTDTPNGPSLTLNIDRPDPKPFSMNDTMKGFFNDIMKGV